MTINWFIEKFDTLDSTQSYLKNLCVNEPSTKSGLVIHANSQTRGYGRQNRTWVQGEKNLYFSFLLPKWDIIPLGNLSILTGLSLAQTIKSYEISPSLQIKWPNDILIDGKKCAGILIEICANSLIIGIGVNTHSSPLSYTSSLNTYVKDTIINDDLLQKFLAIFNENITHLEEHGFKYIRAEWLKHSFEQNTKMSVKIGDNILAGAFQTIDNNGSLVLLCGQTNQRQTITAGDVFISE